MGRADDAAKTAADDDAAAGSADAAATGRHVTDEIRYLGRTPEEIDEAERPMRELRGRIADIDYELSLFYSDAWHFFEKRLKKMEREAIDAMVGGTEDIVALRAKVKLVRHLASLKTELEEERARLTQELEETHE
jgi:hypothetical protein